MNQVHTDEMVLGTVSREAGLHERQPKACRAKLSPGGPPGSSPPRSDGSCGDQAGGLDCGNGDQRCSKELENNFRKPNDLTENRHSDSLKMSQPNIS
jgi:hypothetical protein